MEKLFLKGKVEKGFGRGSKELGIPTANLPTEQAEHAGNFISSGIYYGYGKIRGNVYEMVMSFGWNPFYKNQKRSAEVHLLHKFDDDFYGEELNVVVLGFIRPEMNFDSVDLLIKEIKSDIEIAREKLRDEPIPIFE